MITYPYVLTTLATGDLPIDGRPLRDVHFNRIFREVSVLQSALGPGERLKGTDTDLAARLSEMNTDGSLKREIVSDDDFSGNFRGMTRYVDGQMLQDEIDPPTIGQGDNTIFIPLALSAWDEPPAFFYSIGKSDDVYNVDLTRAVITDISEIGARIEIRRFPGGPIAAQHTVDVHWFAVSRNAKVWEDNVAWALPPVRTGS